MPDSVKPANERSWSTFGGLVLFLLVIQTPFMALAQFPRTKLFSLFPPGGSAGSSQEVQLKTGTDLEGVGGLRFSHPGITAVQKYLEPAPTWPFPKPVEGHFIVTIASDVPPGVYDVRAFGSHGVSNARAFVVSDLEERIEAAANTDVDKATEISVGSVVNGTAQAGTADYFSFEAREGQRLLIDCHAERIDSRMDATLVLYDADGRELQRQRDTIRRDPLVDFLVPADGTYLVKVYDFLHGGGDEYFYRLSVSTGPYIDFIFPPAVAAGTSGSYAIYGRNLPGSSPAPDITVNGQSLDKLIMEIEVPEFVDQTVLPVNSMVSPAESVLDAMSYRLATTQGTSNLVRLGFATAALVVEQEPNNDPSEANVLTLPCEIAGRFNNRRDVDWFTFDATKAAVYYVEVYSHRLGLPTDPYLLIQRVTEDPEKESGVEDVKEVDDLDEVGIDATYDSRTADPIFRFTVPEDGTYRILVRDLNATARGDLFYRLAIREPKPDFRLVAFSAQHERNDNGEVVKSDPRPLLLHRGGAEVVEILAFRRDGFDGEIHLSAQFLPLGVTCAGVIIPGGSSRTKLALRAADNANAWSGNISIVGRARIGDTWVTRMARGGEVQWGGKQNESITTSRLVRNVALAVNDSWRFPFTVKLADARPVVLSSNGNVRVPLRIVRRDGFGGALQLKFDGLPDEIRSNPISVDSGKSQVELELQIHVRTAPTIYTLVLMAETEVPFPRDPKAVAAAAETKAKIDQIASQAAEAAKQADEANESAQQKLSDADAQLEQVGAALEKAKQAVQKASQEGGAAGQKAEEAYEAVKKSQSVELQQASDMAKREAAAAVSRAATASAVKNTAMQALTKAKVAQQAAARAKRRAERVAEKARAKAEASAQAQKAAQKAVEDVAKLGKPEGVKVSVPAHVIGLEISLVPSAFVRRDKVVDASPASYAFPHVDRRQYLVTLTEP